MSRELGEISTILLKEREPNSQLEQRPTETTLWIAKKCALWAVRSELMLDSDTVCEVVPLTTLAKSDPIFSPIYFILHTLDSV